MARVKIPLNKSFSGAEYRAMGHALYYMLKYKGGPKTETYGYMASPKAVDNLSKLCSDWINAYDNGGVAEVTMSLPTEVQEALAAFIKPLKKVKKAKKVDPMVVNTLSPSPVSDGEDVPF